MNKLLRRLPHCRLLPAVATAAALSAMSAPTATGSNTETTALTLRDTLPQAVEELDWHLRLKADKCGRIHCRVIWNADSAVRNFRYLDLDIPEAMEQIDDFGVMPAYTLGRCTDGCEQRVESGKFHTSYQSGADAALSLRLRADRHGARIESGGTQADGIIPVEFRTDSAGMIITEIDRPADILRHSLRAVARPLPRKPPFATTDSLLAYVHASSDPVEGVWDYLDRDIDHTLCTIGGFYTLITIRSSRGSNGYEIYAIDKNGKNAPEYKGLISPGIFMNHYDLQWLDARGHMLTTDTSASIDNASILTLYFPLLKSSVRFRRIRPTPLE